MFWSDPNLYGATFPYKDVQATMPWGTIPRYLPQNFPQTYGFVPPYLGMQSPFPQFTPYIRPEGMLPFLKPEFAPPVGLNPYLFQYNQPIVPWFRGMHF